MGDHLVLHVGPLLTSPTPETVRATEDSTSSGEVARSTAPSCINKEREENVVAEEEPLLQPLEYRICQDENDIKNLETPCVCNGSLKVESDNVATGASVLILGTLM